MTAAQPPLFTVGAERVRCFVGLPLPEAWNVALSRVAARLAPGLSSKITWTRPCNWHITLRFLGEVEARLLPELRAALAQVEFRALTIRLGPAGAFGSGRAGRGGAPRTLWAGLAEGAAEVSLLAGRVSDALAPLGFADAREGARGFCPHEPVGHLGGQFVEHAFGRQVLAQGEAQGLVNPLAAELHVFGADVPGHAVHARRPAAPRRRRAAPA